MAEAGASAEIGLMHTQAWASVAGSLQRLLVRLSNASSAEEAEALGATLLSGVLSSSCFGSFEAPCDMLELVDQYLWATWSDAPLRLFVPDDLRGNFSSLPEAVRRRGWQPVAAMPAQSSRNQMP